MVGIGDILAAELGQRAVKGLCSRSPPQLDHLAVVGEDEARGSEQVGLARRRCTVSSVSFGEPANASNEVEGAVAVG